ncbi:unnamed protein product [Larinioides sclopetarius]|uniref:Uncharacterized protein n=1 Tax=Larinioides sclopetarius TaxID=280406 RepID=A0AAV2BNN8_9ARAC
MASYSKLEDESLGDVSDNKILTGKRPPTVDRKTKVQASKSVKRGRKKSKITKEQPLAKKSKDHGPKKAKETCKFDLKETRVKKISSPTLSQYSSESEYENPEREKLSYFS